jgi:hypothetical protein
LTKHHDILLVRAAADALGRGVVTVEQRALVQLGRQQRRGRTRLARRIQEMRREFVIQAEKRHMIDRQLGIQVRQGALGEWGLADGHDEADQRQIAHLNLSTIGRTDGGAA